MIIRAKVKPNSKKENITKEDNYFSIALKEKAEDNRANKEMIRLLAKYFKVSTANVVIKKGLTSKEKIIEIFN
jgi:uncharacterized protein (TIGR00251 family)